MSRHSRHLSLIILLFVGVSILLLGCMTDNSRLISIRDDDMEIAEEKKIKSPIEMKSVGVYVDATPSIEGFVGWGSESPTSTYICASRKQEKEYNKLVPLTVYRRCLGQINNIISSNFPTEDIRFYCMDTTLWQTENNVLEEAEKHFFYQDSIVKEGYVMVDEFADQYDSSFSSPSVSYAIQHTSEEDFAIVITDLCENGNNSNELIKQLKRIRTEREDEVSIELLGIKSEFAGRVYDIMGNPNQDYGVVEGEREVVKEDIKFRPFYIILIGGRSQIELFTEQLYKNIDVASIQIEKVLFDDYEISGLDYRNYIGYEAEKYLYMQDSGIPICNGEEPTDLELVDITSKKLENQEKLYLFYDISSDALKDYLNKKRGAPEQVGVDGAKEEGWRIENCVAEKVKVLTYIVEEEKFYDENIKDALKVDGIYLLKNKEQIVIECSLFKNEIEGGIYRLSGKMHIKKQNMEAGWIQKWNSSSNTFEGEKTQNLNNFYNAILNTFSKDDQNIVNFSFYFRIRK